MYWDLSLREIVDITDSKKRMLERERKERVSDIFMLALVTANRILCGFNSNSSEDDLLQPWHFYPGLFENKSEEREEQRELAETELFKVQMEVRMNAWNKRFEGEEKNDG